MTDTLPPHVDAQAGSANAISRRDVVIGAGAVLGAAVLAGTPALAQQARVKLRLLETTDLHVNVLPYDYYRDKPDDTVGLARTATLIAAQRARRRRTALLFDNGDLIQGNPMGDYIAYKRGMKAGDVHPMFAGHEHARLRLRHARQSRVQLRPRLPRHLARRRRSFRFVCANLVKARRRAAAEALDRARPASSRTRPGAKQPLKRRRHRLRAAADHAMGPGQSRRQGRRRSDIVEAAQRHVPDLRRPAPTSSSRSAIPASTGGERKGGEENAALHLAEGATASTRSSPATSIRCFRAARTSPASRRRRREGARCTASRP